MFQTCFWVPDSKRCYLLNRRHLARYRIMMNCLCSKKFNILVSLFSWNFFSFSYLCIMVSALVIQNVFVLLSFKINRVWQASNVGKAMLYLHLFFVIGTTGKDLSSLSPMLWCLTKCIDITFLNEISKKSDMVKNCFCNMQKQSTMSLR